MLKRGKRMLFGVCSGISNYTGIDVTVVRLGFVIATLFYGVAIIIYLILAVIIPENEKLEN